MSNMFEPGTIGVEYTIGTGASFPLAASVHDGQSAPAPTPSSATVVATINTGAYPASPVKGQLSYRPDLAHLFVYDGTTWQQA